MKRKFTINEELNRIKGLMSYENGQYKNPIISEQEDENSDDVTQLGKGRRKDNPDPLYDEELYKPSSGIQKRIKNSNPNFDSQLAELKKHPVYKFMVPKMNRNEAEIFFQVLNQESRKVFLDKTLEFLRSFTNKKKLERKIKKDPNFTGIESRKLYNWDLTIKKGKLNTY